MKNIFNLIKILSVVVLLGASLSSCDELLKVDYPNEIVQDKFWQNKNQVETELLGLYTSVQKNASNFFLWGDLRSALYAKGAHISTNALEFIKQDIREQNSMVNWEATYKSINWINNFIENCPAVLDRDPLFSKNDFNNAMAEAYALRALDYFYLVRAFKDVPLVKESYKSNSQETDIPASSADEVLDFVEEDLKLAYQLVGDIYTIPVERYGRVGKNMIRALWADVKLWRQKYEDAIDLCKEIDAEYEGKLVSPDAWFTIFNPGNSQETIFELQYIAGQGPSSPFWGMFSKKTSATDDYLLNFTPYRIAAQELYPEWPGQKEGHMCGDTVRLKEFAFAAALPDGNDEPIEVYKYLGASAYKESYRPSSNRDANMIFYRYRDVIFMEAESLAMLGRFTEAEKLVNKIRASVNAPLLESGQFGDSELEFVINLLKERQFELGFEGKEWFATLRAANKFGMSIFEAMLFDNNGANESRSVVKARLQNPESWYLPYYETEVEHNKKLEQKPYYNKK